MPSTRPVIFALALAVGLGVLTAEAAKPGKGGKRGAPSAEQVLGRFDRDGDGKISAQEGAMAQGTYAALKSLDKDNDGKLSESELQAVKPAARKAGKKKKSASQ
jgi:hypothetical protein